jgi:hypothetical protein
MRYFLFLILTMLVPSCSPVVSDAALCASLSPYVDALNVGALADGGPQTLSTSATMIGKFDAGCGYGSE